MIYTDFQQKQLSVLGFGTMRLPTDAKGCIDQAQLIAMTDLAMQKGVNYFDTAYPYHDGLAEIAIGQALKKYPRESYFLATKYPGHQPSDNYDPADVFEDQLHKCGVDYFDFYLLHNVCESCMDVYLDPQYGIIEYFKEQKKRGRIRHLGFSSHARVENLQKFLDIAGEDMEFCQIQLNWLDWTLQNACDKVALLNERHIPIWVMEPVRGGALCRLADKDKQTLQALRPQESTAAWSFRFLQSIPGVTVILSGMSCLEQMQENIHIMSESKPLTVQERNTLLTIAEGMKDSVPCTACHYCTAGCPMGLDIPSMIATYNELAVEARTNATMWLEALPADKRPSACINCGACTALCPQGIDVPTLMKKLSAKFDEIPKWRDICIARAEAAKRNKQRQ